MHNSQLGPNGVHYREVPNCLLQQCCPPLLCLCTGYWLSPDFSQCRLKPGTRPFVLLWLTFASLRNQHWQNSYTKGAIAEVIIIMHIYSYIIILVSTGNACTCARMSHAVRLEYWVMCKRTVLYYVYKNAAHMHAPMSACMYMWHNYYVNIT